MIEIELDDITTTTTTTENYIVCKAAKIPFQKGFKQNPYIKLELI